MANKRKLSDEQVREIRSLKGTMSSADIATEYGVSRVTIDRIFRNKTRIDPKFKYY